MVKPAETTVEVGKLPVEVFRMIDDLKVHASLTKDHDVFQTNQGYQHRSSTGAWNDVLRVS